MTGDGLGKELKKIRERIEAQRRAGNIEPESQLKKTIDCVICHGSHFLRDKATGQIDVCSCYVPILRQRRMERLHSMARIPLGLMGTTFAEFVRDPAGERRDGSKERMYNVALRYATMPEGWLVLQGLPTKENPGGNGVGKTYLAAAIANHAIEKLQMETVFVVAPDLLAHLRSTFHPDSPVTFDELITDIIECELLVIDDFGAEAGTAWAMEQYYRILNSRYNNRRCTVITTNKDFRDIDPRLRSRLMDTSLVEIFVCRDEDYRLGRN